MAATELPSLCQMTEVWSSSYLEQQHLFYSKIATVCPPVRERGQLQACCLVGKPPLFKTLMLVDNNVLEVRPRPEGLYQSVWYNLALGQIRPLIGRAKGCPTDKMGVG